MAESRFVKLVDASFKAMSVAYVEWEHSRDLRLGGEHKRAAERAGIALAHQFQAIQLMMDSLPHAPTREHNSQIRSQVAKLLEDAEQMHTAAVTMFPGEGGVIPGSELVAGVSTPPLHPYPDDARWRVVKEFADTERSYITSLRTVLQVYADPLCPGPLASSAIEATSIGRAFPTIAGLFANMWSGQVMSAERSPQHCWLSPEEHTSLFQDTRIILTLHDMILKQLESILMSWGPESCVGPVLAHFAPFLKLYGPIIRNFEKNRFLVESLIRDNEAFADFVTEQTQSTLCGGQTIFSYMIQPIQRIPRYRLLLEQLVRHTPEDHRDFRHAADALALVSSIADTLNDSLKLYEAQGRVYDVCYHFLPPWFDLVKPHRRLEKQGRLELIGVSGERWEVTLFLFNDIYVIATPIISVGNHYQLHKHYADSEFVDAVDCDAANTTYQHAGGGSGAPFVLYGKAASYVMVAPSSAVRAEWLLACQRLVEHRALQQPTVSRILTHETVRSDVSRRTMVERPASGSPITSEDIGDIVDQALEMMSPVSCISSNGFGDTLYKQGQAYVAPVMMPDNASNECLVCHRFFSIILRKHHCRNCGDLVCDTCSKSRWKLDDGADPVRVCDRCIKTMSPLVAPSRQTSPSFAISASRMQAVSRHVCPESMPSISETPPILVAATQELEPCATTVAASQLPMIPRTNSSDDPRVLHGLVDVVSNAATANTCGLAARQEFDGMASDPTCIPAIAIEHEPRDAITEVVEAPSHQLNPAL